MSILQSLGDYVHPFTFQTVAFRDPKCFELPINYLDIKLLVYGSFTHILHSEKRDAIRRTFSEFVKRKYLPSKKLWRTIYTSSMSSLITGLITLR